MSSSIWPRLDEEVSGVECRRVPERQRLLAGSVGGPIVLHIHTLIIAIGSGFTSVWLFIYIIRVFFHFSHIYTLY